MPAIFLKKYDWTETLKNINIIVPVPGISIKNLDVFMTEKYIKISCAPFIWEIFLKNSVNSEESVVRVGENVLQLRLLKKEPVLWNEIADQAPDDKKSLFERRQHEISEMQKSQSERNAALEQMKQQWNRDVLDEQMRLEEEEKQRIKEKLERDKLDTIKLMFANPAQPKSTTPKGVTTNVVKQPTQPIPAPRRHGKIVVELTEGRKDIPTRENRT